MADATGKPLDGDAISRRRMLGTIAAAGASLAAAGGLASSAGAASSTTTTQAASNGNQALARLMAGNRRYRTGHETNNGRDSVRRVATADKQNPFAIILSCADSRVAPEVIFDEGVGDLFVVRVAGNTAQTPIVQGSIEYAVAHFDSVLLMVLGHQNCGAVKAALDAITNPSDAPGAIGDVVQPILPAAQSVQSLPKGNQLEAAIEQNVENQVASLTGLMPIVQPAVSAGTLKMVGAEYILATGRVRLLST